MQPSIPIYTPPNEPSSVPTRRYDIDALRSIVLLLLILHHVAISFQSWAHTLAFPQHASSLESLWEALGIMHVWRIPLLFFISGMGVYFAIQHRSAFALLKERTCRILLPYLFGFFVITPLQLTVQFALGLWILPNVPSAWLSFLLLLIGTYTGSFLLFELLKRVGPVRLLFGMKR